MYTVTETPRSIPVPDEGSLVLQARNGNEAAFDELVRRHRSQVYRLAVRMMQNPHDAEDVLQETLLKAYQNLDQFRGNSRFCTWLARIGINEALIKLRQRKADASVSLDAPPDNAENAAPRDVPDWRPNPERLYLRKEIREALKGAVNSLPSAYRNMFSEDTIEERPAEELAAILNLPLSTVKGRALRARLKLRRKLSAHSM